MDKPLSPRRLAENEAFFRQKNRAVEKDFSNIRQLAVEHNQASFIDNEDMKLQFFCECSNANCRTRIPLKRSQYDSIHKANDKFVVACGHEVPEVERIIEENDIYCVIRKIVEPPKTSSSLNPTPISNS